MVEEEMKKELPAQTYQNLISALVSVAEGAGDIIRHIYKQGELGIQQKNDGSQVTLCDITVQAYTIKVIRELFPNLKWIGQQDEKAMETATIPFHLKLPKIRFDHLPKQDDIPIDFENAVLHIDPLDGTRNFTKGELECVTSLFGIAIGDDAKYGVVHHLKSHQDYPPTTYYGGYGLGLFKKYQGESGWKEISKPAQMSWNPDDPLRILMTDSITKKYCNEIQQSLVNCKIYQTGGAGHKFINLIEYPDKYNMYLQLRGVHTWDLCAPLALAQLRGIEVINTDLQPIIFRKGHFNGKCFVAFPSSWRGRVFALIKNIPFKV